MLRKDVDVYYDLMSCVYNRKLKCLLCELREHLTTDQRNPHSDLIIVSSVLYVVFFFFSINQYTVVFF